VILLEMLTGSNPYRGANYTQTVMNHLQMDVPQLPAHQQDYQWLLERMLGKDPDERFADCRVLLASLDELTPDDPDSTRIAPALSLAKPGRGKTVRRALWVWLLVGLLLLAGAAGGGYYLYQQKQISEYLARAELRLQSGSLLEPPQDNADYLFRQVLTLDADNPQALDGLARVLLARLNQYLQLAEQRLADQQLLLPEDDSATHYFRQVLAWEPDNLLALAGINRVAQRFIAQSEAADKRREFALALAMVQQGLEVEPANEQLLQLLDGHEQRVRLAHAPRRQPAVSQPPAPVNPVKRLWNNLFD
jgi:tetratricopeptide (TPR) repeat protein